MSLQTWKEEVYPIPAWNVVVGYKYSKLDVIEHSLRKWLGFSIDVLKKHDIQASDVKNFRQSGQCSLCINYFDRSGYTSKQCVRCPLAKLGADGYSCTREWSEMAFYNNPEPMIDILLKAFNEEFKKEEAIT